MFQPYYRVSVVCREVMVVFVWFGGRGRGKPAGWWQGLDAFDASANTVLAACAPCLLRWHLPPPACPSG